MTTKTINENLDDLEARIASIKTKLSNISQTIGPAGSPAPNQGASSEPRLKGLTRFQYGIVIFETAILSALLIAMFQRGAGEPLGVTFAKLSPKELFTHVVSFIVLGLVTMTMVSGYTQIRYDTLLLSTDDANRHRKIVVLGTVIAAGVGAIAALPFVLDLIGSDCNSDVIGWLC